MTLPSPGPWLDLTARALRAPDAASAVHTLLEAWSRATPARFALFLPDGNSARLYTHGTTPPDLEVLLAACGAAGLPLHIDEIALPSPLPPAPVDTLQRIANGSGQPALWFCESTDPRDDLLATLQLVLEVHDRLRTTREEDGLTGLPNRRAFDRLLRREADLTARYGVGFTLLVLDLDGFKQVNDRHGHAAGDELLKSLGGAMRASLRASDTAARLGGDEFAILLPRSGGDAAERVVRRLGEAVAALAPAAPPTFCCGILETVATGKTPPAPETLMARADELLYAAKLQRPGGRAVGIYHPA